MGVESGGVHGYAVQAFLCKIKYYVWYDVQDAVQQVPLRTLQRRFHNVGTWECTRERLQYNIGMPGFDPICRDVPQGLETGPSSSGECKRSRRPRTERAPLTSDNFFALA